MHIPVLLEEVIKYLQPKPNQNFIDCTIGSGGHAFKILSLTKPNGRLLGIDLAEESISKIEKIKKKNKDIGKRLILVCDNFVNLKKIVEKKNFNPVHGILLDLGLSSDLLEKSKRGFSFQRNEVLDMRYNPFKQSLTAQKIINYWQKERLLKIFREYGEEKLSKRIVEEIVRKRKKEKISTTKQLNQLIENVLIKLKIYNPKYKIKTLARIYQALRIAVNNELENLKVGLVEAVDLLKKNGRIVVISYHSLEDRIVKNYFRQCSRLKILTKKPILPTKIEILRNSRARSAKLRTAIKI